MTPPFAEPRLFLRALAATVDAQGGTEARETLLREVGRRMARLMPLDGVASLEALELEMNEALGAIGWGQSSIVLQEAERRLVISHFGLPRIGSLGEPPGCWLAAALEGLYEAWMAEQSGSQDLFIALRQPGVGEDSIEFHYQRR